MIYYFFISFFLLFSFLRASVHECNKRYTYNKAIFELLTNNKASHTSSFQKITLLTKPVPCPFEARDKLTGHYGVTRSITQGLKALKVPFNYNPIKCEDVGDVVVVMANIDALRQAIEWKRQGKIKKLLAGPNLMVNSYEHDRILASSEIDVVLVPCWWVEKAYIEEEPRLQGHIKIWYVGIDASKWIIPYHKPENTRDVLLYVKREADQWIEPVRQLLIKYGWRPHLIRYGNYTLSDYQALLQKCAFAVFLNKSESQGLALVESWASNVPTLVLDRLTMFDADRHYSDVSASPYICEQTGMAWYNLRDLEECIKMIEKKKVNFAPQEWVLNNMTDEKGAQLLLHIIATL